jgi:2-dehydro-3-deoxygluconokinase
VGPGFAGRSYAAAGPWGGAHCYQPEFQAWEGGGEYNVARGLKRCFGLRTAVVTALADNPVGRLVEDLMYQGGVDQSHVRWVKYDGVGRTVRNGLNFTERGFGVRAALGCSDRGHTAFRS